MTSASGKTTVPLVAAGALFGPERPAVIDLRSPGEFEEDHVPRAANVPLFDDEARRVIGTLYARSPDRAFEAASRVTRERIGGLVERVGELTGFSTPVTDFAERVRRRTAGGLARFSGELVGEEREIRAGEVVLHCWRGGMRSRSVVALLREVGFEHAVGLAGGYKAYRAEVRARLERFQAPPTFVLRGLTGVGKTLVLRALEHVRPGWTVDLEGLAAHRSSILGSVGLAPVSQKRFESLLVERLERGFPGPLVVEGESRKVGDIVLPERLWKALEGGIGIRLTAPLDHRVRVLREDYLARPGARKEIAGRLPFLEERLGARKWRGVLTALLEADRIDELVEALLGHYYDPLYARGEARRHPAVTFESTDPTATARAIAEWIDRSMLRGTSGGPPVLIRRQAGSLG